MTKETTLVDRNEFKNVGIIKYSLTIAEVKALANEYADLTFDTPADYDTGRKAIGILRTTRVAIEGRRKELKADALEYGRKVDDVAKQLTNVIEGVETRLKDRKGVIDEIKKKAKEEIEAAERAAVEAKIREAREIEDAKIRAEQEAAAEKLAEERAEFAAQKEIEDERNRVERERLAQEQLKIDAAAQAERERAEAERDAAAKRELVQQEKLDAERAELDAQREALAADQRRIAQEESDRKAKVVAEEAARVAKVEAERDAAREVERIAALKPDIEKVRAYLDALDAIITPDVKADDAKTAITMARNGHQIAREFLDGLI